MSLSSRKHNNHTSIQQRQKRNLTDTGLAIDYQWQPSKDKAMFIVAKKSE